MGDTFFPVCSPRLAPKLPAHPRELARHTLLRSDDEWWKPWFEAVGLDWPEPARGPIFNDSALMLQAAAEGQGIALARSSLLGNDVRNGLLVRLFDIDVPAPRRYYLVYPPRLAGSAKLGAFRAWLKDEIREDANAAVAAPARKRPREKPPEDAMTRRRGSVEQRRGRGIRLARHRRDGVRVHESADANADKPDSPVERRRASGTRRRRVGSARVLRRLGDRLVARHRREIVVAELESDRPARRIPCAANRR